TPEAMFKSLMWAESVGDTKIYEVALTTEQAQYFEALLDFKNKTEQERSATIIEKQKEIVGFRIWKKTVLSDNQAVYHLNFQVAGWPEPIYKTVNLTNIDGGWK